MHLVITCMCVFSRMIQVETHVRNSDAFLKRVKIAYANNTTCEGIEKSLGVTEALANPKKPDADRPPSIQAGGESLKAGGGGGGKAGGKSGKGNAGAGGNAAAGIAPGGEQGVGWGAVPWGLTPGGANGAVGGKKGKKGGKMKALGMGEEKTEFGVEYGEEKMPDLVDSSHRSALGYSTAVAGVAAAGMNGMGGSFSSNRGMVPPRGMPPSMGGSMTNGMHHRGMSNGVGPHPPGMNMSMMARGPRPTMPQGHSSARMMLENPPPVMMGPDGPVTLIQGGMQGASMPGGPSVMMGPNGPVTLMGAGTPGQTGGAWGSSFGARGPWGSTSTMGSRSFATRFGPQRTRPGIIQRTRSLGMENVRECSLLAPRASMDIHCGVFFVSFPVACVDKSLKYPTTGCLSGRILIVVLLLVPVANCFSYPLITSQPSPPYLTCVFTNCCRRHTSRSLWLHSRRRHVRRPDDVPASSRPPLLAWPGVLGPRRRRCDGDYGHGSRGTERRRRGTRTSPSVCCPCTCCRYPYPCCPYPCPCPCDGDPSLHR